MRSLFSLNGIFLAAVNSFEFFFVLFGPDDVITSYVTVTQMTLTVRLAACLLYALDGK